MLRNINDAISEWIIASVASFRADGRGDVQFLIIFKFLRRFLKSIQNFELV